MKNKLFIALLTTLSLLFGAASVSAAGLSAGLSVAYGQAEGSASENVGGQIETDDADGEIIMPSIFVELQLDLGPISPSIGIDYVPIAGESIHENARTGTSIIGPRITTTVPTKRL